MEQEIISIKSQLEIINEKLDKIILKIDNDVTGECKKMGDHIDFIENIYSNVKKPLGFVCSKLQLLIRNDDQNYSLTENMILEN